LPYPPPRLLKFSIPDQKTEKPFDPVTVLIRRLTACESLRLPASSTCPLDLVVTARRIRDYRAARSPRDDRTDFIGVGRIWPERGRNQRSAGVHEGTGRGTVAYRKERPNRPREEDRNTETSRRTLVANDSGAFNQEMMPKSPSERDCADRLQIHKKQSLAQATKSAETTLDNAGSFREGTRTDIGILGKIQ
jgi:hypothetical protein